MMLHGNNYLTKESLLVIGGTGFIGTFVAKEAVQRGFNVSVVFNKNYSLVRKIENIDYIKVDITNKNALRSKLKNIHFDHVINLSGYVDHGNYFDSGDKIIETHFQGVKNLVNTLDKQSLKSFVQIGSSDEYGLNSAPQIETQRELPISSYAFAKSASSHFLQMLYRTENLPLVVLRPFLVYGPGQDKNRFLPQVIEGCLSNLKFPVSEGAQLRDFCYITDIVDAILSSVGNKKAYGEVINIASGRAISIKDIVVMVRKIIGKGDPTFGEIKYRPGENMNLYANISKAKKILNWTPQVSLEKGLEITILSTLESKKNKSI
jgi:nucleoside-diphosphate-sugar epimerase